MFLVLHLVQRNLAEFFLFWKFGMGTKYYIWSPRVHVDVFAAWSTTTKESTTTKTVRTRTNSDCRHHRWLWSRSC